MNRIRALLVLPVVAMIAACGTVSVSDARANDVSSEVNIPTVRELYSGGDSPDGILYNAANDRIYVANESSGSVTVLNPDTGFMEKDISLPADKNYGKSPIALTSDPVTGDVFVLNRSGFLMGGKYWRVSAADFSVQEYAIRFDKIAPRLSGIAYNPKTRLLYVTCAENHTVRIVEPNTGRINRTISAERPEDVTVDTDTGKVYVANGGGGTVSVIDPEFNPDGFVATIPVGKWPVAVSYSRGRVYVANEGSNSISVIDASNYQVVSTVQVGAEPRGVVANPYDNMIYVTNSGSDSVSIVNELGHTLRVGVFGSRPEGVAVNPKTGWVYATSYKSDGVISVITP